jgi:hypothetical protein
MTIEVLAPYRHSVSLKASVEETLNLCKQMFQYQTLRKIERRRFIILCATSAKRISQIKEVLIFAEEQWRAVGPNISQEVKEQETTEKITLSQQMDPLSDEFKVFGLAVEVLIRVVCIDLKLQV